MKFILSVILMAILSYASGLYLPWWSIAIAVFIVSVIIPLKPGKAFLSGFISVFLLWAVQSYIISSNNGNILAHRISQLMIFMNSPVILVLLTGMIGGLVAGFAALAGSYLRYREKEESYYKKLA